MDRLQAGKAKQKYGVHGHVREPYPVNTEKDIKTHSVPSWTFISDLPWPVALALTHTEHG